MELDKLTLLTGIDILFEDGNLIIHQPTIEEIAFVKEEGFFLGCQLITSSKKFIDASDKKELNASTNFDIFMIVMKEKNPQLKIFQNYAKMALALLFPTQSFSFEENEIKFIYSEDPNIISSLNNNNQEKFCKLVAQICSLKDITTTEEEYNPSGPIAARIAKKLDERHKKLMELKNQDGSTEISILSRYISILSVGLHIPIISFKKYTIFQIFDEWNRFLLHTQYDTYVRSILAGGKDLKEPEDWMKDLYDKEEK